MSPHAPPHVLRDWITRHLDPLDQDQPVEGRIAADIGVKPVWPVDTGAPPKHAAVLIGLIARDEGVSVLLTRRSDNLRSHTGQVAFPGGRRDPGESAWQTALREAHEEVGLDPSFVSLVGLSTPYWSGSNYLITPVVGFIREGFSLTPNPDEVADIFETPFGFLMNPDNHQIHERQSPDGELRRFYAMTHEDRYIWGVTAGVLRELYDRLYGAAFA